MQIRENLEHPEQPSRAQRLHQDFFVAIIFSFKK